MEASRTPGAQITAINNRLRARQMGLGEHNSRTISLRITIDEHMGKSAFAADSGIGVFYQFGVI